MIMVKSYQPLVENDRRAVFAGHDDNLFAFGYLPMMHVYGRIIRRRDGKRVMRLSKMPRRDYRPVTLVMK